METIWEKSNVVQINTWLNTWLKDCNNFAWNTALDISSRVADLLTVQERNTVDLQDEEDIYTFIISQWWIEFEARVPLSVTEIESPANKEFTLEEIAKNKYPKTNPLFDPNIESTFTELWIDWEDGFIKNQR